MPEAAVLMTSPATAIMPSPSVRYVHSRAVRYQPCVVDLRWRRSVHSCETCPLRNGTVAATAALFSSGPARRWSSSSGVAEDELGGIKSPSSCTAVHHGVCMPVRPGTVLPSAQQQHQPVVQTPSPSVVSPVPGGPGLNGGGSSPSPCTVTAAERSESPPPPPLPEKRRVNVSGLLLQSQSVGSKDATQPQQSVANIPSSLPQERKENSAGPGAPVATGRGDPEGESDSFLRRKEAELRQKREREAAAVGVSATPSSDRPGRRPGVSAADTPNSGDPTFVVPATITTPSIDNENFKVQPPVVSGAGTIAKSDSTSPVASSIVSPISGGDAPGRPSTASAKTTSKPTTPQQPQQVSAAGSISPTSSLTGTKRPASVENIPQFYFPAGAPTSSTSTAVGDGGDAVLRKVKEEFDKVEDGKVSKSQVGPIVKALGLPLYWKCPVFNLAGGDKAGHVTLQGVLAAWKKLSTSCQDDAAKFIRLLAKPGRQFVEFDDFLPFVQDVVDTHPGLTFLQDAPEFHSRYVQTVISRIFYSVNRSWTGRIPAVELRKSNFLQTVKRLEEEDDINQITDFFSYEHFYVIYCKFWELDKDHDLLISKDDLGRHNDHAISVRVIDRIFSGAVTRNLVDGKLSYKDFVWFLMSEEDKRNPRSIEYWFRCMDLDGDGIISMYEMEYFYNEQVEKMEMLGIETLPFQDCLCQMLDMVRPQEPGKVRLRDLKACTLTPIFFDTFINLDKYLEHEQKDPFSSIRDQDGDEPEPTDWERYAAEEYELLVAEEGEKDNRQEDVMYEDDFEPDNENTSPTTMPSNADGSTTAGRNTSIDTATTKKSSANSGGQSGGNVRQASTKKDDIYDFSNNDLGY